MGDEWYRLFVNQGKLLWLTGAKAARALIGNTNSISQYTARHRLIDFYHLISLFPTISCCFHTVITWGVWKSVSVVSPGFWPTQVRGKSSDLTLWAADSWSTIRGPHTIPPPVDMVVSTTPTALWSANTLVLEGCNQQKCWILEEIQDLLTNQTLLSVTHNHRKKKRLNANLPNSRVNDIYRPHSSTLLNLSRAFSNQLWKMENHFQKPRSWVI